MNASQDSASLRLETALDRWQKQIAAAHLAFTSQIDKIHERLSKLISADIVPATVKKEAPVEQLPADSHAAELKQRIEALETMLRDEQDRADRLEMQSHDSFPDKETDSLAERLASAIHDRDEAHQEIVSLRTQLGMLQRANAALASAGPELDGHGRARIEITDSTGNRLRFGEILVRLKIATPEQVESALEEQKGSHRRIGAILTEQGVVTEALVSQIVARQLDLPFIKLTPGVVDEAAPKLISAQLARQRTCIPIAVSPERIVVAMANPFDLVAMDDIEAATGRKVDPAVATPSDIAASLRSYYGKP